MIEMTTLEWDWWKLNQTPHIIEAVYEDTTGTEQHTYLDTGFIESYLIAYEPELFISCCLICNDDLWFSIPKFRRTLIALDWDDDNLIRDMIYNLLGPHRSILTSNLLTL